MSPARGVEQEPLVVDDDDTELKERFNDEEVEEDDDDFIKEQEEELEKVLTEDIYSLLYTSPLCGLTYVFAFVIFALQAGLLLLIFIDLVDMSSEPNETNDTSNRLNLPVGAELEVTIAQFVAMLITVMVMASDGDCVKGIMQLTEGYDPSIMQDSPNATFYRWFLTGVIQTLVGLLQLGLSFVLTMQSTTVIDLTLNLTGLYFIQELDDMGFTLAAQGLVSKKSQEDCAHIAELNRAPSPDDVKQKAKITKRLIIFCLGIALLVPYFLVVVWQYLGIFMCKTLYVQFGDAYDPDMSYYSGIFEIQGYSFSDRIDRRPHYKDDTGSLRLAYCRTERAWCFSQESDDPCDYIMKSSETENFDVIEIALDGWLVKTDSGDVPVDWLAVACYDCNKERCNGVCRDNRCDCEDNQERLGFNCEFEIPTCRSYALDFRTKGSLASIPGARLFLETQFTSLTGRLNRPYDQGFGWIPADDPPLTLNGRLWYVPNRLWHLPSNQRPGNDGGSYFVDSFMVFMGRRWVIFSVAPNDTPPYTFVDFHVKIRDIVMNLNNNNLDKLRAITRGEDFSAYKPAFFSTPVNFGSESHGVEPSGIQWVLATQDEKNSSMAAQSCFNDGMCTSEGQCLCTFFYDGSRCEYVRACWTDDDCYNGGRCDLSTNICECPDDENHGLLCQYPNDIKDPFFCSRRENDCNAGTCNGYEEKCDCFEGYQGNNCEVQIPSK